MKKFRFPIRFKILIALLFVVTTIVGIITFTMANLFHTDKSAYIRDLTSVVSLHTGEEANSLLKSYKERIRVFTRVIYDQEISSIEKSKLLEQFFGDFSDFISVTTYITGRKGSEPVTIYDSKLLESVNLGKEDIENFIIKHPVAMEKMGNGLMYIDNATITGKLPAIRMSLIYPLISENKIAVVSTMIKLERLLQITNRSKVFEAFVIDQAGILISHNDRDKVVKHVIADWLPDLKKLKIQSGLSTTLEFEKDNIEMVGGFTQVGSTGLFAGVQIPKAAAYLTARELLNNLMIVSLSLLLVSAILGLFGARLITSPIDKLSKATEILGQGRFDVNVEVSSRDEIGELAQSFNSMASELDAREKALKNAQSALVQSEKMSAFGQLSAGIAHEVKNPLAGILGYAQLSKMKLDKESPLYNKLDIIEKETKRCKEIIDNLMKFARQEEVEYEKTDINKVVEDAISIVNHQLTINEVKIIKDLSPEELFINGNGNQIQQVLMNFMINAMQAMDGNRGKVGIKTAKIEDGIIEIRVMDNGPGMPEEVRKKIFEPFFTTKPAGKGTGLGLAVSYGIITDHKGNVFVKSIIGKGTLFVLRFPEIGSFESRQQLQFEPDFEDQFETFEIEKPQIAAVSDNS